jgi:hypothetical protein
MPVQENRDEIIGVYLIVGDLWSVVFKPRNPVEALIGGRVIRVRAKNEAEAIERARKRKIV